MTTVENDKKMFKELLGYLRLIIADLIFLTLHFALVDTSLIISRLGNLNIEVEIFEVLLTILNYSLVEKLAIKQGNHYFPIKIYFISGGFVIMKLILKYTLGSHSYLASFTINSIAMGFMPHEISKLQKIYLALAYIWYISMFSCLYGHLQVDIRLFVAIPLILATVLFGKFIGQIFSLYHKKTQKNNKQIKKQAYQIYYTYVKFVDFGFFMGTGLPLYWAFISKDILYYSCIACLYHGSLVFYLALNEIKFMTVIYIHVSWAAFRMRANTFSITFPKKQLLSEEYLEEKCNMCTIKSVNICFPQCKHIVLCMPCHKKAWQKGMKHQCLLCKSTYNKFCYDWIPLSDFFDEVQTKKYPQLRYIYTNMSLKPAEGLYPKDN